MVDVLAYLNSKQLVLKRAPGDEYHTSCWLCNEPEGKRGRLYVNTNPDADIPGLYHCKVCDSRGSLVSIQKHFGDATEKQEKEDTGYIRRAILATAARYYAEALDDNVVALRWLTGERGLSIETIESHQLGWADGGLFKHLRRGGYAVEDIAATGLTMVLRESGKTADFLQQRISIPYHVAGSVVMIRGRAFGDDSQGSKYITPTGQKTRLFNTDSCWTADEIVVTEGEFDCLVAEQMGYAAVACPGANVWQDSWTSYFSDVRRAWIVFDREDRDTGAKGAAKVLDHLGAKARSVELPPHDHGKAKNDITEYIVVCGHTRDDFDALLRANRGLIVTVAEAIAEHSSLQGQVGIRFGIRGLDLVVKPGLLKTQVMVLLASSGTGKTILLLNLFQRICTLQPAAKVLFVSLEQTRGDWWERARRIYRFFTPGASDLDAQRFWAERLWIVDRNRITPEQLLTILEDFTVEVGSKPDLVAIDYLGYWAQSFRGERYERTSDAIMAIKEIAKDQRIAVLIPHQVNRSVLQGTEPSADAARDSGVVLETADFLLSLWSDDMLSGRPREERNGEYHLKILKSRHGGVGYQHKLWFAPLSLAMALAEEEGTTLVPGAARWARNEMEYQRAYADETWEHAQTRHRAGTAVTQGDFAKVEQALYVKMQGRLGIR